ncbi:hypothetical protein RHSIM_Rhsim07G0179900 [Rhododendron simsii]|uniref:TCHQD class glutathione S-transferase n=1 Tax=Rhododendron simsii TaxID=118357 RepID=A0A834GR54_RHOSS|nr:hypothetical protein RHSIM_Rhsim07G0179900 [Rhododendron simsii]
MQLYHHPFSMDSQKVRLALEERGIDYTSFHVNPITGKNMDSLFFRMNTSAKLPVLQNGAHIIYDTVEIIQYIEQIAIVSSGGGEISSGEVVEWINKIQEWNPKYFTLSHVPDKYRHFVSKFTRRVAIARMAEYPDLASAYHCKLREEYETQDNLRNPEVLRRSGEYLVSLLDEVETKLGETPFLVGEEFTMADVFLVPVLARLELLNLQDEYIHSRPNIAKYKTLFKTWKVLKQELAKFFGLALRSRVHFRKIVLLLVMLLLREGVK